MQYVLQSLAPKRDHRIHLRRTPRRQITAKQRHERQQQARGGEDRRIAGLYAEQQRLGGPAQGEGQRRPGEQPYQGEQCDFAQDPPCHSTPRSAEGDADADFTDAARHGVGHHSIQPDRRKRRRQRSEANRKKRQEPVGEQRFIRLLAQGLQIVNRQVVVTPFDLTSQRRRNGADVLIGSRIKSDSPKVFLLGVRQISERPLFFAYSGVFAVFHDADDLDVRANVARTEDEMAADRIPIGEESTRHRLVDDRDLRTAGRVRDGKFPPAEERNAHRGEIIRPDPVTANIHFFVLLRLVTLDRDVGAVVAVGEDRDFGGADGTHTGKGRDALAKIIEEGDGSLRRITVQFRRY